jgi:hypothetical protein
MASQSLISVRTTLGYESQWVRVLIYVIRSSCNLCTVACRALHCICIQWLFFDMCMVILSYIVLIILAIKRKTYVRSWARFASFASLIYSIKFSRPIYKTNSKQWLHCTCHTIFVDVCLQNTWQIYNIPVPFLTTYLGGGGAIAPPGKEFSPTPQ